MVDKVMAPVSLSVSVAVSLRQQPAPVVGDDAKFVILRGDEELAEWHNESRTSPRNETETINYVCTPSVTRFYRQPREDGSDLRVNITPMTSAYLVLNGEDDMDDPKSRYLFNAGTGIFNKDNVESGYPMQAYITMQGNRLKVLERRDGWVKFETLTPSSNIRNMTFESHPHLIHRFDLVCWNVRTKTTYHKPVKWGFEIYYFLVSKEGYGWLPARYVREIQ